MKVERLLASRFSRRNLSPRSRVGMRIAVTGVALAVAIMLLAVSVVLGFKNGITRKIVGFDAQIVVRDANSSPDSPVASSSSSASTISSVEITDNLMTLIKDNVPEGSSIVRTYSHPAILKTSDAFDGLFLKAFADEYDFNFEKSNLVKGEMFPDSVRYPLTLSAITARALRLDVGDKVDAFFQINGSLKMRRFTVTALFDSNFSDFDRTIAYTDAHTLSSIVSFPDSICSAIEIRGLTADDPAIVLSSSSNLSSLLFDAYQGGLLPQYLSVDNVYHKSVSYFAWLDLLDTNVLLIIILMAFVAGFTLVSSTFIIVLERVMTIGILKSMGATDSMISRTFLLVGLTVVIRGLIIGNVVALSIILLQSVFHILPLDPDSYFLSYVPVKLSISSFIIINLSSVAFTLLLLLIPSRIISRIPPSSVINYE